MAPGFSVEIPTKVSPARIFQAGCRDYHKVAPVILPGIVTGGKLLNGDGGVGSIKCLTFSDAVPYSFNKERVDELDEEKYHCVYALIEGGDIGTKVSSAVYTMDLTPTEDGGCVFKLKADYEILPGVNAEEYVEVDKQQSITIFKALEGYLLENPQAYA